MTVLSRVLLSLLLCLWAGMALSESRGLHVEPVSTVATSLTGGFYRALIIGNNDYQDPEGKWKSLENPVTDAKAVASVLRDNYGFSDIQYLENATRKDILNALTDLSKKVMKQDSVLVYYAGHGYLEQENSKGFWIPVDAVGKDQSTFVRNSTIRDELTTIASRVQHTLLISDSCFSGTLLRRGTRGPATQNYTEQYYDKVASKKSVQIVAAGGVEYVDDNYRSSGHSPFTYFLLNELKHNNQPLIAVSELSANVEKAVANNADQVPESGVLQGAGDELGEFVFIKVNLDVKGIPADRVKVAVEVTDDQGGVVEHMPKRIDGNKRPSNITEPALPLPVL